jgi:hypothetical protein
LAVTCRAEQVAQHAAPRLPALGGASAHQPARPSNKRVPLQHHPHRLRIGEASAFLSGLLFLPVLLALVFRGIYPSYALAFNKSLLALSTRVTAYILVLHDNYPSIEESDDVTITFPEIDGGAKLHRYLPLVKWLLALPLYIVGFVYVLYGLAVLVFTWFTILFTGKMPAASAEVLVGITQYWNRVYGYAFLLVTDEYPSFSL